VLKRPPGADRYTGRAGEKAIRKLTELSVEEPNGSLVMLKIGSYCPNGLLLMHDIDLIAKADACASDL
jgi:hypothetical protein